MSKRRLFEVAARGCLFINQATGSMCRAPVPLESPFPFCLWHKKHHDRMVEVIGESTPIQPQREERKQAL